MIKGVIFAAQRFPYRQKNELFANLDFRLQVNRLLNN